MCEMCDRSSREVIDEFEEYDPYYDDPSYDHTEEDFA